MKQLDIYSSQIQRVYLALEDEIIKMLIKQLNTKGLDGDNFNVYSWHLDRLNQLGALNEETAKLVSKATKISKPLLEKMIKESGYDIADATSKTLSNGLGVDKKPVSSNVDMILRNMQRQTFLDMDNLVNQTLITTNAGQGTVSKAYQSVLDSMVANVSTGTTTAKQALNKAMYDLVDKGLKSGLIDKGGHHWSIEAYTRTVLDSTKYRVMNETRMEQAHEYDVHTFVMSSHPASRAACAPIQGKVVNDVPTSSSKYDSRYPSIYNYGYGEPAGCFGINCHHMKYPFIPGVNTNHQEQYDPIEAQENGKIQQKQRQLERAIRNSKRKLNTANELGDREGAERFKQLIWKQQSALRHLTNKHKFLTRDYSREKVISGSSKAIKIPTKKASTKLLKSLDKEHVLSDDLQKDIQKEFDGIKNPAVKEFYAKAIKNTPHTTKLSGGNSSAFNVTKNYVQFEEEDVRGSSARRHLTLFWHEYGHAGGRRLPEGTYDEVRLALKKDFKKAKFQEVADALSQETITNGNFDVMHLKDMYQAIYGYKKWSVNYFSNGHKRGYFTSNKDNIGSEAFAEVMAAMAQDGSELQMMKKYVPKTVSKIEEIMKRYFKN